MIASQGSQGVKTEGAVESEEEEANGHDLIHAFLESTHNNHIDEE